MPVGIEDFAAPLFQFLSGAIKRSCGVKYHPDTVLFQFLSGAIKRTSTYTIGHVCFSFQFLSGAIKRAAKKTKTKIIN